MKVVVKIHVSDLGELEKILEKVKVLLQKYPYIKIDIEVS